MAPKIKSDVLEALENWKAGKPVKSLELGHVHRMKEVPGFSPTIDDSVHFHQDQERAHAYCFSLIEQLSKNDWDGTHEEFLEMSKANAALLQEQGLTEEEKTGAESLAWKALRFGWARAIEGHKETMYITVKNPAVEIQAT